VFRCIENGSRLLPHTLGTCATLKWQWHDEQREELGMELRQGPNEQERPAEMCLRAKENVRVSKPSSKERKGAVDADERDVQKDEMSANALSRLRRSLWEQMADIIIDELSLDLQYAAGTILADTLEAICWQLLPVTPDKQSFSALETVSLTSVRPVSSDDLKASIAHDVLPPASIMSPSSSVEPPIKSISVDPKLCRYLEKAWFDSDLLPKDVRVEPFRVCQDPPDDTDTLPQVTFTLVSHEHKP
jgi:hypothetical protein